MIDFKHARFESDIILVCVRWYLAYPLSYRNIEEMMEERGVDVDHSTLNRWVIKFTPHLETAFRRRKRPVGNSWRMDETYIKIKGQWKYLYRAVDKDSQTIDFLLTAHRNKKAALRFLKKAIRHHGVPDKMTIDKSGANRAAIEVYNAEQDSQIEIRQIKYLNNLVEQDHRTIKRITRPMLGFKSFRSASITLRGIVLMHMIKKSHRKLTRQSHILACALAGKANLIVSRDLDLLRLKSYEGIGMMSPIDFLHTLEGLKKAT
jgi:transposase-like protein